MTVRCVVSIFMLLVFNEFGVFIFCGAYLLYSIVLAGVYYGYYLKNMRKNGLFLALILHYQFFLEKGSLSLPTIILLDNILILSLSLKVFEFAVIVHCVIFKSFLIPLENAGEWASMILGIQYT